jgi:hypothetical protein
MFRSVAKHSTGGELKTVGAPYLAERDVGAMNLSSPACRLKCVRSLPISMCLGASPLSPCHPDRSVPGFPTSRLLATATFAALLRESRMPFISATSLNRKSGGAQWRDLQSSRKVENPTFQPPPASSIFEVCGVTAVSPSHSQLSLDHPLLSSSQSTGICSGPCDHL